MEDGHKPTVMVGTLWEIEASLRAFHESTQSYFEGMRMALRASGKSTENVDEVADMAERDVWRMELTPTGERATSAARPSMQERVGHIRNERELYEIMGRGAMGAVSSSDEPPSSTDSSGFSGRIGAMGAVSSSDEPSSIISDEGADDGD